MSESVSVSESPQWPVTTPGHGVGADSGVGKRIMGKLMGVGAAGGGLGAPLGDQPLRAKPPFRRSRGVFALAALATPATPAAAPAALSPPALLHK